MLGSGFYLTLVVFLCNMRIEIDFETISGFINK